MGGKEKGGIRGEDIARRESDAGGGEGKKVRRRHPNGYDTRRKSYAMLVFVGY